jgi:hypothetical protein
MVRHNHLIRMYEIIVRSYDDFMIVIITKIDNDPYAGSPTNTLLRLLLPLNDPV